MEPINQYKVMKKLKEENGKSYPDVNSLICLSEVFDISLDILFLYKYAVVIGLSVVIAFVYQLVMPHWR